MDCLLLIDKILRTCAHKLLAKGSLSYILTCCETLSVASLRNKRWTRPSGANLLEILAIGNEQCMHCAAVQGPDTQSVDATAINLESPSVHRLLTT